MNRIEFKQGIEKLEMAYNQKFSVEKLKLWWDKLNKMSASSYLDKIEELIIINKFMPNIAEILDNHQRLGNYKQRDYSNYDFSKLYANEKE